MGSAAAPVIIVNAAAKVVVTPWSAVPDWGGFQLPQRKPRNVRKYRRRLNLRQLSTLIAARTAELRNRCSIP
jgi:hypothetical protein